MHRKLLVAVVAAGLVAVGCGSDDTESTSDGQAQSGRSEQAEKAEKAEKAKPKPNSHRAQMVRCIEDAGYEVSDDGKNKLSIKSASGTLEAVTVIHSNRDAARKATVRGQKKGVNAVAFGRAEVVRHAAKDTEAGVIINCVAAEYAR